MAKSVLDTEKKLEEAKKRRRQKAIAYELRDYSQKQKNLIDRYGNYNQADWHTQDEANAYYNALQEVRDLTDLYRYYVDTYDSGNKTLSSQLGSAVGSYDDILSGKDDFLDMYSQYTNPEDFNAAYAHMQNTAKQYGAGNYNIEENQAILDQLYKDREVFKGFESAVGIGQSFNMPISDGNGNDIYFAEYFPEYDKNADLDTTQGKKDALESLNLDTRIRELEDELRTARLFQAPNLDDLEDFSAYSTPTRDAERALKRENLYKRLTDEERARYYYLYNTQGADKATQYAEDLTATLESRQLDAIRKWSGKNIGTGILGTLASFGTSAASMLESIGDQSKYFMSGGLEEMDDIYTARMTDAYRSGVTDNLGGVGDFVYGVGTSAVESYLASLIPGGGLLLGANAAASAINSALDRGATSEQAFFSGLAAGAFETLFESFSIERLKSVKKIIEDGGPKALKDIVKQVAVSMGVEASEEAATEAANLLYDTIALGDISNYELAMQEYMDQGMSEDEARKKVYTEFGLQIGEAALSGAVMGGVKTGAKAVETNARVAHAKNKYFTEQGKNILNSPDAESIIEEYKYAANEFKDVDSVAKAAGKYNKKATASRLGRLEEEIRAESAKRSGLSWEQQKKEISKAAAEEKKALAERASANVQKTMSEAHLEAQRLKISSDGRSGVTLGKMSPIVDYSGASSDKIMIKDVDGNAVKLSEAELADDDVGVAYILASQLGSVDAANAFIKAYNAESEQGYISPDSFYVDWLSIQSHGQISTWDGAMEKAFAAVGDRMSEASKGAAFLAGRGLRESVSQKYEAEQAKYDKAWKEAGGKPTNANFKDTALRGKTLSKDQQDYRSFLRAYSRAMGTNVEVFYSEKGARKENGSYNRGTNTLRIDINAGIGNKATYDAVQNNVIGTLSHETVHNMRVTAPKQYEALRDFVTAELEKNTDYDLEKNVEDEIARYEAKGQKISREDAIEEIVARACEDRLGSSEALRDFLIDLYAHDKDAANGFVKAVKEFLARLKEFFEKIAKMKSTAPEAQKFAEIGGDIVSELQKFFDEGVLAMREGNMARNAVKEKASTESGWEMLQLRDLNDTNDGAVKSESKQLIKLLNQNISKVSSPNKFDVKFDGKIAGVKSEFVNNVFESQGGKAENAVLGQVILGKKGAKSTIFHGYGKNKLVATYAIKDTIENGDIILSEPNYNNSGVDRYIIAAKGLLNNSEAYIAVIVEGYPQNGGHKQFYLHEVMIKETAPHIMTATQYNADTVSGTVSANSISQNQQKSSDFEKNSEPIDLTQRRDNLPSSSEILADVFKSGKAYEKYAEHSQSLKKYKDLQVRLRNSEKRIDEIDAEIKKLRSQRAQSGKGTRMDELYRMRKTAENKVQSFRNQMFEMEAGDLYNVVISESQRLVEKQRKEDAEKYREKSKERTQNISKRGYIEMIEKRVKLLSKAIAENSKDKHVPEIFKKTVGDFIAAIDFSSKRALGGGAPTGKELSLAASINAMSDALTNSSQNPDLSTYLESCDLKGDVAEAFAEIAKKINDIALANGNNNALTLQQMTVEELKALSDSVRTITHLVSAANKLIGDNRYARVEDLFVQTIEDLKNFKEYSQDPKKVGYKLAKMFEWDNALPYYAFKRMGKAASSLFEEFQDGFDDFAFKARDIVEYTEKLYNSKESRAWTDEIHQIEINKDRTVYMTTADIMSLYCLSKRTQARNHLFQGGIILEQTKTGHLVGEEKSKKKTYANNQQNIVIDEPTLLKILSNLTERQREVADGLQKFMVDECAKWGNEISMKRFGVAQFLDPTYFPITSSSEDLEKNNTQGKEKDIYTLLNASFTQKLNLHANNTIEVSDIFDVFATHAIEMAKYHAFAIPLIDMRKWENFRIKTGTNLGAQATGFETEGVRKMLKNAFGAEAERYINTFLKDINSLQDRERGAELLQSLASKYKVQAVAANINVALIQPISYIRVSAVMNPKYMLEEVKDTFKIREAIKKAEKHSGMMVWKSLGYRDVNIAASLSDKIKHTESMVEKLTENVTLKGAEIADRLTWGAIWIACENEITDTRKDLSSGSEEYNKAVSRRFREVIYATQVIDSPLTKTQFMRGKSFWNSLTGAFMSEPSLSYNLFLDVATDIMDDKRKGKKLTSKHITRLGRATIILLTSSFAEALIRSFFDALHDYDEEDEEYLDLYFSNFWETFLSSTFAPKTPILKTVYEAFKGAIEGAFGSSAGIDIAFAQKLGRLGRNIVRAFQGKDVSWTSFVKSIFDAFSSLSGIPLSNVWREVKSIWNIIVGSQNPSALIK